MRGIDAVLQELAGGAFDLKIGFDGDLETADSFDTSITVSLLSDQRANEAEALLPQRRRGWIGDEARTDGFLNGSKLWLLEQSRRTRTTLNQAADAARIALQWLVSDGFAVAIRNTEAILTPNGVRLEVTIERSRDEVDRRFFDLWQNTGVS